MPPLTLYEAPELYDLAFGPGPCEPFYSEEARRAAGPVLELACGTGRLTIPIARDGHEIVGLDASPAMLGTLTQQLRMRLLSERSDGLRESDCAPLL
jgi:SAM-dependent methyltransferase